MGSAKRVLDKATQAVRKMPFGEAGRSLLVKGGSGLGRALKRDWGRLEPVSAKAAGVMVSPKDEFEGGIANGNVLSAVNGAVRKATGDRLDFTSRESSEMAGEGFLTGGWGGAIAGGLAGTAAHYVRQDALGEGGTSTLGLPGIDDYKRGSKETETPASGGGGAAKVADAGSVATGGEVVAGEAVGLGGGTADAEAAEAKRQRALRGRLVGVGPRTFGFTEAATLGGG